MNTPTDFNLAATLIFDVTLCHCKTSIFRLSNDSGRETTWNDSVNVIAHRWNYWNDTAHMHARKCIEVETVTRMHKNTQMFATHHRRTHEHIWTHIDAQWSLIPWPVTRVRTVTLINKKQTLAIAWKHLYSLDAILAGCSHVSIQQPFSQEITAPYLKI